MEKFIRKDLETLRTMRRFVTDCVSELDRSALTFPAIPIAADQFHKMFDSGPQAQLQSLTASAQEVKDAYYGLMKDQAEKMSQSYQSIITDVESLLEELRDLPETPNREIAGKAKSILNYARNRVIPDIRLGYDIR